MHKFNVAIDGPAGAGKSTVARMVAKSLGYVYVDTGAMYRAVTWKVIQSGLSTEQEEQIIRLVQSMRIELVPTESGQQVFVDGEDVTEQIRSLEVNRNVSKIAQIGGVRELLAAAQKNIAKSKGVVMDGRDIGTHVLPDAEVKIFLTASVHQRAQRRFLEMNAQDSVITLEQLERDIALRDQMDEQRDVSPLIQAEDAVLLDSTRMDIPQVVVEILRICRTQVGGDF